MSRRCLGLTSLVVLVAGCQLTLPVLSGQPTASPSSTGVPDPNRGRDPNTGPDPSLVDVQTMAGTPIDPANLGKASAFTLPSCIVVDSGGVVYVGDSPGLIMKVSPDGQISTVAGAHEGYADGSLSSARFRTPRGLALGKYGDLIVSDSYNHRIRRIAADGTVTTIAGSGEAGFADGQGPEAKFNHPADLEVDANGGILVADFANNAIRRISPEGAVSTLASGAQLSGPDGLALSPDGTLYVSESESGFLRKITTDGAVATIGNYRVNIAISGPDMSGFNYSGPFDVAVDKKGRLLLASSDRLLRLETGSQVTTLAGYTLFEATMGEGPFVYASNAGAKDGPGLEARFFGLNRLAFGPDGTLYESEIANRVVRKITFRPED